MLGDVSTDKAPHQLAVVLAEDNGEVRDQIRTLLSAEFEVLDAVADGGQLLDSVRRNKPDLVVCDIHMPGLSGIDAGQQMIREGLCASVVALTMYRDRQLVDRALAAGIRGYVLKMDAAAELFPALYSVAGGGTYLSRGVKK